MTSDPMTSEPSLAPLSRDECLALLRQGSLGRLAVVIHDQPHILPLNYAADEDGVIVFRTADLTAATAAVLANVAFEIDEIDLVRRHGWSVAVHGFGDRDHRRRRPGFRATAANADPAMGSRPSRPMVQDHSEGNHGPATADRAVPRVSLADRPACICARDGDCAGQRA